MQTTILVIIFLIFLSALISLAVQFFNIFFRGYAPFISTRPEAIEKILAGVNSVKVNKVYELGCGRAGFLRAVSEKFPNMEVIGIENAWLPYLVAKIQVACRGCKIKIKKGDLFKADISEADLIYCYLNQKTMDRLAEKFKQEGKQEAQIVSYLFPIAGFKADKVIEIGQDKVYFYTI